MATKKILVDYDPETRQISLEWEGGTYYLGYMPYDHSPETTEGSLKGISDK